MPIDPAHPQARTGARSARAVPDAACVPRLVPLAGRGYCQSTAGLFSDTMQSPKL